MERLPKDITFNYNVILIITNIIIILLYLLHLGVFNFFFLLIVNKLIQKENSSKLNILIKFNYFFTKPFKTIFDELLKYKKFRDWLVKFALKNFKIFKKFSIPFIIII